MARQDMADRAPLTQRRIERIDGRAGHAESDHTPSRSNTRTAASTELIRAMGIVTSALFTCQTRQASVGSDEQNQ
jgi:hypothetical protein